MPGQRASRQARTNTSVSDLPGLPEKWVLALRLPQNPWQGFGRGLSDCGQLPGFGSLETVLSFAAIPSVPGRGTYVHSGRSKRYLSKSA